MNNLLENIVNTIENLEGVLKVQKLSSKDILNLIDIESDTTAQLIPVINEGMKECFKQDYSFVIFKKAYFRLPPSPTILLKTASGKVLGHEIFTNDERKSFENNENILFLSEDFIIFRDIMESKNKYPEKEFFVLPPVDFPELEDIEGIFNVISSSPSTKSDEYLKENYGYGGDSSVATILLSFSIEKD